MEPVHRSDLPEETGLLVMRIAVAGATGNIGSRTVAVLARDGHDVVPISRSLGVDLSTGDGLDAALAGVAAVHRRHQQPADRPGGNHSRVRLGHR